MMKELGVLAEQGGLKNFTALAEAVTRIDASMKRMQDKKAVSRLARMLDHVFTQAYRGETPMSALVDRVVSVLDLLGEPRPEPQSARDNDAEAQDSTEPQATEPACDADPEATCALGNPEQDASAAS